MKNQSGALLHFSGYPLRIADAKPGRPNEKRADLLIIKSTSTCLAMIKNEMVNNPKYWDEGWFCNYE